MLVQVMTKARKHMGVEYPAKETDYAIMLNDDKSMTIYHKRQPKATFKVGDQAEYGSYNLRYLGVISKITDKAVTIIAYKGTKSMEQTHRLGLNEFCWRNADFDLAETIAYNQQESMCI